MLITNNKTKKTYRKKIILGATIIIVALLFLVVFQSLYVKEEVESFYYCNMETVIQGEEEMLFECEGQLFSNAITQSNSKAFGGEYSSKCDEINSYGPTVNFDNVNSGDVFEASVWRQSEEGYGVLAFQGEWGFYDQADEVVKMQNGWELIQRTVIIPIGVSRQKLRIYPYNNSKSGNVYFDDLRIRRLKNNHSSLSDSIYNGERLNLRVDEKGLRRLNEKRLEAYQLGNLITDKTDLVASELQIEEKEIPVDIRLKGDLLDHLKGKKWSFRIICKDNQSWKGMSEFSIHNTASRHHIAEWIFHKMLEEEDVLTSRYDFIEVALNDETLGLYAYEEHFKNALLRHQNRQIGPILRINEDAQWHYASKHFRSERPEVYQSTQIEPFEAKKVFKDRMLTQAYLNGQNRLYEFMKGIKKPTEVFDVERMAKYIAILDVCMAYHAFSFTNIRFYYNPVTAKLEPIGFDGYTDDGTKYYFPPTFSGAKINDRVSKDLSKRKPNSHFHYYLFNDLDFTAEYAKYLEIFTSEDYLNSFLTKYQSEIESRVKFIQKEHTDYQFRWHNFSRNAKEIREYLFPMQHISLKAYRDPSNGLLMESYHYLPIEILGFGNEELEFQLQNPLILEAFSPDLPVRRYGVPYSNKAKYVFFKTLGTTKVDKVLINKWQIPEPAPLVERGSLEQLGRFDFLNITDNTIIFKTGKHSINQDVIIPKGFELRALPGTELQLVNGSSIVSYSPVFFEGVKEKPIIISSQNANGQGFALIDATGKSILHQVVFQNLSPRNKNGQITEAAVTIHGSDVHIERCYFMNLKGKDGLGLIRSKYFITDCFFENSQSDALDADFSTGQMESLRFENIGRDAIEVSGGFTKIYGTSVNGALGIGLNANLHTNMEVGHLALSNCAKGVSVTDLSEVKINQLVLNEVPQGMVAYKRLAEFGGGYLEIENYEATNVKELHLVEKGARMIVKGEEISN